VPELHGVERVLQVGLGAAHELSACSCLPARVCHEGAAGPDAALGDFRCTIRYWRNEEGDVYASRHRCRRGTVVIRFYGMV
jgi:hypothetical protein